MKKGTKTNKPCTGRVDLAIGAKFNRWTIVGNPVSKDWVIFYPCKCECGTEKLIRSQQVREGRSLSCGCLRKERLQEANVKHGMSHTPAHNRWMGMVQRCTDPHHHAYKDYGGRGIKVCERWLTFENFYADMGDPPQPGMSLDRYPDNDGNYEPGNVRWATKKEQANNRRSSKLLTYNGETRTQAEWEDVHGLRRGQLWERLDRGWELGRALTTPRNGNTS